MYTDVEIYVSPEITYLKMSDLVAGSIRMSATISYARITNLGNIKGNLTAIRYRDEILHKSPSSSYWRSDGNVPAG